MLNQLNLWRCEKELRFDKISLDSHSCLYLVFRETPWLWHSFSYTHTHTHTHSHWLNKNLISQMFRASVVCHNSPCVFDAAWYTSCRGDSCYAAAAKSFSFVLQLVNHKRAGVGGGRWWVSYLPCGYNSLFMQRYRMNGAFSIGLEELARLRPDIWCPMKNTIRVIIQQFATKNRNKQSDELLWSVSVWWWNSWSMDHTATKSCLLISWLELWVLICSCLRKILDWEATLHVTDQYTVFSDSEAKSSGSPPGGWLQYLFGAPASSPSRVLALCCAFSTISLLHSPLNQGKRPKIYLLKMERDIKIDRWGLVIGWQCVFSAGAGNRSSTPNDVNRSVLAPISAIFWLHVGTVAGSGDASSIFIYTLWSDHVVL